jgi:hypothetical protein
MAGVIPPPAGRSRRILLVNGDKFGVIGIRRKLNTDLSGTPA